MDSGNKPKTTLIEKVKSNKKLQILILIITSVVVILLFLSGLNINGEKSSTTEFNIQTYVNDLENKLSKSLSKVSGVGKVSVVINVESGMETVLATDDVVKESDSWIETSKTPIIVNGKTVVIKELYPKITGVLIVAEGANSIAVRSKIQQATVSLLNIAVNKIEILTMS